MKADISISILLPTRGRTTALARSITSLINTATQSRRLELLLVFDDDDEASLNYFQDHIVPEIEDLGATYLVLQTARMGYARLHEYVNLLASYAQGDWLLFWNDDALMESQGWDDHIRSHDSHFRVLRMPTHNEHPYAIFPIIPRAWYDIFGYLSLHQLNDAWISQIAYMLDIMHNIDVRVTHDRQDLTGNNNDPTFRERVMYEGNPNDPRDFNHQAQRKRRLDDAARISQHLRDQGHDMSWFQAVCKGQQDPWARMCSPEFDPNHQVARYG